MIRRCLWFPIYWFAVTALFPAPCPADLREKLDAYAGAAVEAYIARSRTTVANDRKLYDRLVDRNTERIISLYPTNKKLEWIGLPFSTERVTAIAFYIRALHKQNSGDIHEVRRSLMRAKELRENVENETIQIDGRLVRLGDILKEEMRILEGMGEVTFHIRFDPNWLPYREKIQVLFHPPEDLDPAQAHKLQNVLIDQAGKLSEHIEKALQQQDSPVVILSLLPPNLRLSIQVNDATHELDPAINDYIIDIFENHILITPNLKL